MDIFTAQDLQKLAENQTWGISLYMPTHPSEPNHKQDRIRLKNLLKNAEKRVAEMDAADNRLKSQLDRAAALAEDMGFWREVQTGLAFFISAEHFSYFRLPQTFAEKLVDGPRFYVKPLMVFFTHTGRYYALALSQKMPRLFLCTPFGASEIEMPDLPGSLEEALGYDWRERMLQFYTGTPGGGGPSGETPGGANRPAVFHGQGYTVDEGKEEIEKYFRIVDKHVAEALTDKAAPLILMGVDYQLPIYRSISGYASILDKAVEGNPDKLSAAQVRERTLSIAEPYFERTQEKAVQNYLNQTGTQGRTTDDIRTIVSAAHFGRIDTLFVALGKEIWGAFDPQNDTLNLHDAPTPDSEDLLNLSAIQTILNSGTVYTLPMESVPSRGPIAALLRY